MLTCTLSDPVRGLVLDSDMRFTGQGLTLTRRNLRDPGFAQGTSHFVRLEDDLVLESERELRQEESEWKVMDEAMEREVWD